MRPIALKLVAAAILLILPFVFTGCIVCPFWCGERHPPRLATLHVYVYDYYTYAPIPWAVVELYEEGWWSWEYQGSWPVNPAGYAAVQGGYLYHDGCGGSEDKDFRLVVGAAGYWYESFEIELDYWYPAETVYFYLTSCDWCGGGVREEGKDVPSEYPLEERPADRITVGEPREAAP